MLPWVFTQIGASTTKSLGRTPTGSNYVGSPLQMISGPWTSFVWGRSEPVELQSNDPGNLQMWIWVHHNYGAMGQVLFQSIQKGSPSL